MRPTLPGAVSGWITATTGSAVRSAEVLPGATSSQLWRVETEGGPLVLRLFTNRPWLESEPDLARHELAALRAMENAPLPTPRPLAADGEGTHCPVPAILMSALPGRVVLNPPKPDRWLDALAGALAATHEWDPGAYAWTYRSWIDRPALAVPPWTTRPRLWERGIERVRGTEPADDDVFLHRDYHPTNVLFEDDTVSGVVDWVNACHGPTGVDLSHCRGNLVQMYGVEAAERFLAAYQRRRPGYRYDPSWDVTKAVEYLPRPKPYAPWQSFGLPIPAEGLRIERLEALLERALAALSD